MLTCELEAATSFRIRRRLILDSNVAVNGMVGMHVAAYMKKHSIGDKIAGRLKWETKDRRWRDEDVAYVDYY